MPRPSDPNARSRLLAAAERIFIEHGLDGAKVEDITRAAALSKGAFYLHFKTKDDAFQEILSSALAELGAILGAVEQSRETWVDRPYRVLVEEWLDADLKIFECLWKHRSIMRLVLEGGGSPKYHHLIEVFADGAQQTTERLIQHGMAQGYYRADLDVKQAGAFVAGGYDRLARRLVRERRKPNLERWLLGAEALCVRALGTTELIDACVNVHAERLSESARRRRSA
ncbi:MAG TPA: helix-turn-helix domain-containing protein [Polyangiaceae bacterium]|nr:helix-turn-helix domain-containing protein [Polyangiaceae bacterium]